MDIDQYRTYLEKFLDSQSFELLPPIIENNLEESNRLPGSLNPSEDGYFIYYEDGNFAQPTDLNGIKHYLEEQIERRKSKGSDVENLWIYLDLESGANKDRLIDILVVLQSLQLKYKEDSEGELFQRTFRTQ